jgi:NAD(P)-dependent dehydrogenase (short-subunit alcohol dehydrogenase family)
METSCVVTGGARGIGRAIAVRMVDRGHHVVITDVDGAAAAATAAEIGAAEGIEQDIREPDSHRRVAAAAGRHGVLIAWFNNAGICHDGLLADLPEEVARRQVEVNLLGTIWGMRAAIDAFGEHGGDIVNTASLSGLGPVPDLSVYAATKAAVVSLTMSVDAETPKSVRVHAVCPDGVQTAMLDAQTPGSLATRLVHSGGRILTADEVAQEAVDLVGARRVILSIPRWRGAMVRGTAIAPSVAKRGIHLIAAQGKRRLKKQR